jgi:hypothetical protein
MAIDDTDPEGRDKSTVHWFDPARAGRAARSVTPTAIPIHAQRRAFIKNLRYPTPL